LRIVYREKPVPTFSHDALTEHGAMDVAADSIEPRRSPREVLAAFLQLGLRSFGGPIAHIGYFRDEFVIRRKWLDESAFAELVALCQFLPGPASSQVGFAIGLLRGGYLGGLAAWAGFTLPSAIALVAFAYGSHKIAGAAGHGLLHGLQIVAVAIVAQAVWGMARSLCPDRARATIATIAALTVCLVPTSAGQIATLVFGALAGLLLCRSEMLEGGGGHIATPVTRRAGLVALTCFFVLLLGLPLTGSLTHVHGVALFEAIYRSGALVFGGGHVVLPLLREAVVAPGFVGDDAFLAGYGAAQAVPGPLFTFAAFLGAVSIEPPNGILGAIIALVAIFLPGLLILLAALPFWESFRRRQGAQAVVRGVNAAVVGLLAAALYNPIFVSAVKTQSDFALALLGFMLLTLWRVPPVAIVLLCVAGGIAMG
jgi:chromate transporter